ncbi:MAG: hypothetical protein KAR38_00770 [Calditrichia bacterium]|nr:hypothetical protein [Calditrichia bacterium]
MKKNKIFIILIYLIINSILVINCTGNEFNFTDSTNIKDCLIYIEDLRGNDGIGMGNYGDIVIFDPINNKKYLVTDDKYYYQYPTVLLNDKKILFESKREDISSFNKYAGESNNSNFYEINLLNKSLKNISKKYLSKFKILGNDMENPSYNHSLTKLSFFSMKPSLDMALFIYDIQKDSLIQLIDKIRFPVSITWSEIDNYIAFNAGIDNGNIGIIDFKKNEIKPIFKKDTSFTLGGFKDNKLFFAGYLKKEKLTSIFQYSLEDNSLLEIYKFPENEFFIRDLKILNDDLVFLGDKGEETDIY